jgi:anti-sigma regulatory factor (Ser/Thr protein kinase)/biotin operon repressor
MATLKEQILQHVRAKGRFTSAELMERFKVSRQAVHRHIQALLRDGTIIRQGSSRRTAFYISNARGARARAAAKGKRFSKRIRAEGASEDRILAELESQEGLLAGLDENALGNLQYSFTEMLNNAIDHSGSTFIDMEVLSGRDTFSFEVRDAGVGVFANIMKKLGLGSEMEAIEDLLKGKQTTMPERHSGEGIFFTSKVADRFVLESHGKRLIVDNRLGDTFLEDIRFLKGTRVTCEIDAGSKRRLADVFSDYTSEEFKFDRTKLTVKLFESGGSYVSRSQAKRLLHSLENFREVVLDFSGVASVGQAFADEIFRVFHADHPDIRIEPIDMSENVEFMVRRALAARGK